MPARFIKPRLPVVRDQPAGRRFLESCAATCTELLLIRLVPGKIRSEASSEADHSSLMCRPASSARAQGAPSARGTEQR